MKIKPALQFISVLFTALSALTHLEAAAQEFPLTEDSKFQPGVPRGATTDFNLEPGGFYPGTSHPYTVYAPPGYDGTRKLPIMIFLDREIVQANSVNVPAVLDNLIAKQEIPPMLAVLVNFGIHPSRADSAQNRYERAFEYDAIDSRYSNFLVEELLPAVTRTYAVSNDPDDRAVVGLSSSAVGAFVAAWHRPDQFHRVISFIGTYINMKGADALAAQVRKTEPKPLRIFMQDGRMDHIVETQPFGTFYAGSWPISNQVLFESLQFAGYDATYVLGPGGHNMKQPASMLPDALRWLWRHYPEPITVKLPAYYGKAGSDPRATVYSTVSPELPWQAVGDRYGAVSSPVGDNYGNVFFIDQATGVVYRVGAADGRPQAIAGQARRGRLALGADGRIYISQPQQRRVVRVDSIGKNLHVVATGVTARAMAIDAKGAVYYVSTEEKTIGRIDPDGTSRIVYRGQDALEPSGIALSPDQEMIVVSDANSRFSWSFQIGPDGMLRDGLPFYRLEIPDGVVDSGTNTPAFDTSGQVYFATAAGIQVCEANGRAAQILNPPIHGTVSGITFAGPQRNWIYAAQGGRLFRRPVQVSGVVPQSPIKAPKPPL